MTESRVGDRSTATGNLRRSLAVYAAAEPTLHLLVFLGSSSRGDAGGTAVLAHPAQYKMTNAKLGNLADEFVQAGGTALEVVSGKQAPDLTRRLGELANAKHLLGSSGSDFHRPGLAWSELGQQSALPADVRPVWDAW